MDGVDLVIQRASTGSGNERFPLTGYLIDVQSHFSKSVVPTMTHSNSAGLMAFVFIAQYPIIAFNTAAATLRIKHLAACGEELNSKR